MLSVVTCSGCTRRWLGGSLAGAHGLDDGSSTGDGVTAGVHALAAGLALVALGDDAAVLVGLEARRGGADEGVGLVPRLMMTVSTSIVNSLPFFSMGRRRPEASGSPSSISMQVMALTKPFSSGRISTGLQRVLKIMPLPRRARPLPYGQQLSHAAAVDDVDLSAPRRRALRAASIATLPPPTTATFLPVRMGVLLVGR